MTISVMPKGVEHSFDRPYLLTEFPDYDYNNPLHSWEMDIDKPDGPRNCAWQMQAFHYYWCLKQCQRSGEIGLSLGIPHLPYCFLFTENRDEGHMGASAADYVSMLLRQSSFSLIVASAALQKITCMSNARCDNDLDVVPVLRGWMNVLRPGGVLIAALMDEKFSAKNGRSLKESGGWSHTWSPQRFANSVLRPLAEEFLVSEFDTFKNGMSFNVVLQRKE